MHLLNWRNPEVRRNGRVTSITINSGGIFDGLDIDESANTSHNTTAVVLNTMEKVHIRGSRIKAAGGCIRDVVEGRKLELENSVFENYTPPTANQEMGRPVDIWKPHTFIATKCDFLTGGGIKVASNGVAGNTSVLMFEDLRIRNIESRKGDGAGGFLLPSAGHTAVTSVCAWRSGIQLSDVNAPGKFSMRWIEISNGFPECIPGDCISGYAIRGLAGAYLDIEDILVDGCYPCYQYSTPDGSGSYSAFQAAPAGNRLTYAGGGLMVEMPTSEYVRRRRCIVIGATNYGISVWQAQNSCPVEDCIVVSSAMAPDGTKLVAGNVGLVCTSANGSFTNNSARWMNSVSNPWPNPARGDWYLPSGTHSGNTTGAGGAVTLADEQAARALWIARKREKGRYPGSQWVAGRH